MTFFHKVISPIQVQRKREEPQQKKEENTVKDINFQFKSEVQILLVAVSIQKDRIIINAYKFLNMRSSISFIDENVQKKLKPQGNNVTRKIADKHRMRFLNKEKFLLKINKWYRTHPFDCNYNNRKRTASFNQLSVLPDWNLFEVGMASFCVRMTVV